MNSPPKLVKDHVQRMAPLWTTSALQRKGSASECRNRLDAGKGHYQNLEEGRVDVTIGTLERLSRELGVDVRRLVEL